MKKRFCLLLICALMLVSFLAPLSGCTKNNQPVLRVYNWGDYIGPGVISDFEKETGIKVEYSMFETNEQMYMKLKKGAASSYDVVIPSDYMIRKMINENMLEKLDMTKIPNYSLIDDKFKNLAFDAKNEYSIPYMWGTLGIAYNTKMVKEPVDSWQILWNPKYKKQIFMMNSVRDSLGLTLKMLGHSMNTKDLKLIEKAKDKLIEQKPLVLAYTGDEVKDKMIAGEAAMCVIYAGDGITIRDENPDVQVSIPTREGSNLFFDSMCVVKDTPNMEEAEKFINFMCRTDIAARNREEINYSTPQKEVLAALPADVQNDAAQYPSDAVLAKCEVFEDLATNEQYYIDMWTQIIAE